VTTINGAYQGSVSTNTPAAICSDSSGNVYTAGTVANVGLVFPNTTPLSTTLKNSNSATVHTFRFNTSGELTGTHMPFNSPNSQSPQKSFIDPSGNIYYTFQVNNVSGVELPGYNASIPAQGIQGCILKNDKFGNPVWAKIIGSTYPTSIDFDSSGNVYVSLGTTSGFALPEFNISARSNSIQSTCYMRLNNSGNITWAYDFSSISGTSVTWGMKYYEPLDRIYTLTRSDVSGFSLSGYSLNTSGATAYSLLTFNSSGTLLWSSRTQPGGNSMSRLERLEIDVSGNLYTLTQVNISGYLLPKSNIRTNSSNNNLILSKYDPNGVLLYDNILISDRGYYDLNAMTVDADLNMYLFGTVSISGNSTLSGFPTISKSNSLTTTFVLRYNQSGIPMNMFTTPLQSANSLRSSSGILYLVGSSSTSGFTISGMNLPNKADISSWGYLTAYTISGSPLWGRTVGISGFSSDFAGLNQLNNELFVYSSTTASGRYLCPFL
jgi:hypothetical protein